MMEAIKDMQDDNRSWQKITMKYSHPDLKKSVWQILNSIGPYLLMLYLLYLSLDYPYWLTILLSIPAAGFLIRIFIIFHDCGHKSFFKSQKANLAVGKITGILAFTPFYKWHGQHWIHHATSANLDKRGIGDVWTMTVDEYLQSSKWQRFVYRAFRNPFVMFIFGPVFVTFVTNRVTTGKMSKKEKMNVWFTNLVLLAIAASISLIIGIKAFLLIQLPVILIAHSIGLWLFYIQHQYDEVLWVRNNKWEYKYAALFGSSFLRLGPVLQWFTGNIGFHHVHHLSPKIPNYNLEKCHYENDIFKEIKPIRLMDTFKALTLNLWDEHNHRMIRFRQIPDLMRGLSATVENQPGPEEQHEITQDQSRNAV
ncbi:MAG TPA: fatty acid desaturase [Bacteroidales bacterium]|nr:fatty acid desaturase [Bacteroidales bacterium]